MAETRHILLSLRRKLVQFEAAGNTEKAKATKARIRKLEKSDAAEELAEAPAESKKQTSDKGEEK